MKEKVKYLILGIISGLLVCLIVRVNKMPKNAPSESDTLYIVDTLYIHGKINPEKLVQAFAIVESSNREKIRNKSSGASGIIQIMPIMIDEANRLSGYDKYCLDDRFDKEKSFEIFHLVMRHKNPEYDLAKACHLWNPNGSTEYTKKIEETYKELMNK